MQQKNPYFRVPRQAGDWKEAGVAKLADVSDLGSDAARHVGSSPSTRTTEDPSFRLVFFLIYLFYYPGISRGRSF